MMASHDQISLFDVLDLGDPGASKRAIDLPNSFAFGDALSGGFIASILAKHALVYASERPKLKEQSDVRSSYVSFYRPVFPHVGVAVLQLDEISIGKIFSTLRVQLFQGSKAGPAASGDFCISKLSTPGISLNTGWKLHPPPPAVDLDKLLTDSDSRWASYHIQYISNGAVRPYAYIKFHIPSTLPTDLTYVEQWISPGWNCHPSGSFDSSLPEARWTNDMIQFVMDLSLPAMENFHRSAKGEPLVSSVEKSLEFARLQKEAREAGKPDWRALEFDGPHEDRSGTKIFKDSFYCGTLSLSTEIKRRLPDEGVRWLYLRVEAKSIINGRMDSQALLFDENMELMAISLQHIHLLSSGQKTLKKLKKPSL